MPSPRRFIRVALLLLAGLPLAAAEKFDVKRITPVPADQPVPVGDFFRPRLFRDPRLNPSGSHLAALVTTGDDQFRLLVYELKTQKIETLSIAGERDIDFFEWLNDRRLVYGMSTRKLYGLGLFGADVGRLKEAFPLLQYCGATLVAVPPDNRLRPLVWIRADSFDSGRDGGPVTVNTDIKTGRFVDLTRTGVGSGDSTEARDNNEKHIALRHPRLDDGSLTTGYLADKAGRLEFGFTSRDGLFSIHQLTGETWTKCPIDLESIDILGSGNQPGQLVALSPRGGTKPRALQFMTAATGATGEVLLQDDGYDFTGWLYRDPRTRDIVGAVYERNGPHVVWFDAGYRELQKILNGFFPGVVVRILGSDEAAKIYLVMTFSDRQPPVYSWVDLEKRSAGLIKNSAPWIDPKRMQPMSVLKFRTRDGRQLDAYVTLPAGATKQTPPPLVVLPHGGPWARDSWGYHGEVQFLASRGYAVLQPNYRGSLGYGWMFPEEDEWDFRKMHDDVTDATNTLLKSGLVDRRRVAIMGTSFGGYLALSGVAHEPDLYRCAVTIAGVFDWAQLIQAKKYSQFDNPTYARLLRKLGDPARQKDKFEAISPLHHVANVRVPVFISHGKDDQVAEVAQSRRLIAELRDRKIPHETLLVAEEGHGMGHLENELELYSRIESFLATHLLPAPTSASANPGGP